MGFLELLLIIVLILAIAAFGVWLAGMLAPGHPTIIDNLMWVIAVLLILYVLAGALGVHDVRVPRVFGLYLTSDTQYFTSQSYIATSVQFFLSS